MDPWWQKYRRAPFAEKGRGPAQFDCWGLLKWTYEHDRKPSVILPGYEWCYETTVDRDRLADAIFHERQEKWVPVEVPQEFDAVLVNMLGVPMHVGVYTRDRHMLHCALGIGTAHESIDSIRWRHKVEGFFRYVD